MCARFSAIKFVERHKKNSKPNQTAHKQHSYRRTHLAFVSTDTKISSHSTMDERKGTAHTCTGFDFVLLFDFHRKIKLKLEFSKQWGTARACFCSQIFNVRCYIIKRVYSMVWSAPCAYTRTQFFPFSRSNHFYFFFGYWKMIYSFRDPMNARIEKYKPISQWEIMPWKKNGLHFESIRTQAHIALLLRADKR